ncbi:phosphatidylinositol 4-kinase alpha [Trichonephila clavipes]|nr:phosphatidylinositol 4-kinase alpha [Trichonephila clavipes]
MPERLNGTKYLAFLQHVLPELCRKSRPHTAHRKVGFMHDGTSAHFSIAVRSHFHSTYTGRWIGRSGPFTWPSCSPNLNPLDFFYCHLKALVSVTTVATLGHLTVWIVVTSADITSTL